MKFHAEHFLKKGKKLADTKKQIIVPQCQQKNWKALAGNKLDASKSSLKGLVKAQKKMDIVCSRTLPLRNIMQYVGLARHKNMKY